MWKRYSHLLRTVLWLAGLLAVCAALQHVILAHRLRVRGLEEDFPAPAAGADVPMLGVNVALEQYDEIGLERALTLISEGGFTWVRQSFYLSQIEPEPGLYDWTVPDRIAKALAGYPELRLVAVLDDDPSAPPDDPARFAAFAGAFAARYGRQVDIYQIWDEPNLAAHWGGGQVSARSYADLLARSARAIRDADRWTGQPGGVQALILLAGLAPTTETGPDNLSDVRYLEELYRLGAAPYFDAVAGKPYGFDTGPEDRRVSEGVLNFSRLILLREVMVDHGDAGKALWASHWGWNALPAGWEGDPPIWGQTDQPTQASRTIAALTRARSEWPWAGALILEHFQPLADPADPRWGFALVGADGSPRPVYQAVAAYARSLPDAAPPGGYPALNPWVTYTGTWRSGPLGADIGSDGDQATFRFEGTAIALTVRRGPYRAFLYVTVDGQPASRLPRDEQGRAFLALTDEATRVATVPIATGLEPGPHTVEVVAERGWEQWALVDWRVGIAPVHDGITWKLLGLAAIGFSLLGLLLHDVRGVAWQKLGALILAWPAWGQFGLAVLLAGILWAAAIIQWGLSSGLAPGNGVSPGPWLWVGLGTAPALVGLFALRPALGLALVAFSAAFSFVPGGLVYRALSLPEMLVLLCAAGLILRIAGSAWQRAKLNAMDGAVALLVLAAATATLFAADVTAALWELRTVFVLPALYYLLLRRAPVDPRTRYWVAGGWVAGGVAVALVGLGQYALGRNVVQAEGGLARLQGLYPSPNSVGLYLGRVWPLPLALALWGGGKRLRMLSGLALVPLTLALALSFSRGALLLGLPAALVVMGWQAGRRSRYVLLGLVIVGALALIPLTRLPRFASLLDVQEGSTFFRLQVWRSAVQLIREHPLVGVGPGGFQAAYRSRYILPSAWQEPDLAHPHSIYLDHWTRLGLLGAMAGVCTQWAFWRTVGARSKARLATDRAFLIGLAGSMAALLAHGLVDNTVFYPDMALAFLLTLALAQALPDKGNDV